MSAKRKWGLIETGEMFEELVRTLIGFEDSNADQFGKRGSDGSMDVRSGDGKTVYQAKHHVAATAAKVIRDAKAEAKEIKKRRNPKDAWFEPWKKVTKWVLVTNAKFNANDKQKWRSVVEPLFKGLGLKASYWESSSLDKLLTKHPEVNRAFFEGESRVFLSPREAERCVVELQPFDENRVLAPFIGRQREHQLAAGFLTSSKRFLLIHGSAGVGKTRFLLESACRIAERGGWQVLWANVHTMTDCTDWFRAIIPERQTLVVLDDPEDPALIRRLREQLIGEKYKKWKVVLSACSANDPVLGELRNAKAQHLLQELLLEPMTEPECEEACMELLKLRKFQDADGRWGKTTATTLARQFNGYPIWCTLAVHLLEKDNSLANLPKDAEGLCHQYVDEMIGAHSEHDELLAVARWVSLLGPVNTEDQGLMSLITERAKLDDLEHLESLLSSLVSKRLVRNWGTRNRLLDLKPDVLADYLLRGWLCKELQYGTERYKASTFATQLANEISQRMLDGTCTFYDRRMLSAIVRTEFLLRQCEIPTSMGAPVFDTLNAGLPAMTATHRLALVDCIHVVAAYYPEQTLILLRRLRLEEVAEQTIEQRYATHTYGQADIVLQLPQAINQAAHGLLSAEARRIVVGELYALMGDGEPARKGTETESESARRAKDALRNVLQGGPGYWCEFGEAAAELAVDVLDQMSMAGPGNIKSSAVRALVVPLCAVERTQTSWDRDVLNMRRERLLPGHPNMSGRELVLQKIKQLLDQFPTPARSKERLLLWSLLSDAHQEANRARIRVGPEATELDRYLTAEMFRDLTWAKSTLRRKGVTLKELRAARPIWDWHMRYDKDESLKRAGYQLEGLYRSTPRVHALLAFENQSDRLATDAQALRTAKVLASGGNAAVESFWATAEELFGDEAYTRVFPVARHLGELAQVDEEVAGLLTAGLQTFSLSSQMYSFVTSGVMSWVRVRRHEDPRGVVEFLKKLLAPCNPERRVTIFNDLYGYPYFRDEALLNAWDEFNLVRDEKQSFIQYGKSAQYVRCTLWGLKHDWSGLKARLAEVLSRVSAEEHHATQCAIVDATLQGVEDLTGDGLPSDLLLWFWQQLVATHGLEQLRYSKGSDIDEIMTALGKAPSTWLIDAARTRAVMVRDWRSGWPFVDSPCTLVQWAEAVNERNAGDADSITTVDALLGLMTECETLEEDVPEMLVALDPNGFIVPARVAEVIGAASDFKMVRALSTTARYYGIGTSRWRPIARAALIAVSDLSEDERESVWFALCETGAGFWSSRIGEVPQKFVGAVDDATRCLKDEQESLFERFWRWRIGKVKFALNAERERVKEEGWH